MFTNIEPNKKNFLLIAVRRDGYAEITHAAMTDEEIDEIPDYSDAVRLATMEAGESFVVSDGSQIVTRIS